MENLLPFLAGGGEMGKRIREFHWDGTALGSPDQWPAPLRTTLRILLTTNHPAFLFWGPDLICFYNDSYSRSLGPEKHPTMLGARGRVAWEEIWSIIGPQIEQVMSGGGATWHENHLVPITRHGRLQQVYWTYSYGPVDDESSPNGIGGVLVLCSETTAHVRAEQRLRAADLRWRELFDKSPGFMCVLDAADHRFEYSNRKFRDLVGERPLLGKTVAEALPEFRLQGFEILLDEVFRTGEAFKGTAVPIRLDRRSPNPPDERFIDVVFQAMRDSQGQITGVCVEGIDVTDHVHAETELRASREQFRVMADGVPGSIWVTNGEGEVEFVNREYRTYFGVTDDQLRGNGWKELLHPEDALNFIVTYESALTTQSAFTTRTRVRHASGEWRWVVASGVPRFSDDRRFLGHVGMSPDITELVTAQEALRRADRLKDDFLATLAHELRSPLAPIRNAAQIIRSCTATDSARKWSVDVIERQVQSMARLLDDLLDISRVTRGMLPLARSRVRLTALVDAAVEVVQPLIVSRGHSLSTHMPLQPIELDVDPVRFSQVLSNLLTNAAKYTDPGGRIGLSACVDPSGLRIEIADSGIGLAADELELVFEMFSQVKSGVDRSAGGLGIGLALVKGLVELHGGSIEVRSPGIGKGSTFIVLLPMDVALVREAGADIRNEPPRRTVARRVLVADDNGDAVESMHILLQLLGHEVRVAMNGDDALRVANEFRPDIAFLDIGMPAMDGYQVARALRAQTWGGDIKLIALTGWAQDEDKRRALEFGFDLHLTKPVDPGVLEACLSDVSSTS